LLLQDDLFSDSNTCPTDLRKNFGIFTRQNGGWKLFPLGTAASAA
jgi:hypothetical protein